MDYITISRLGILEYYQLAEPRSIGSLIVSIVQFPAYIALDGTLISGIIYHYLKRKNVGEKITGWEVASYIFGGILIIAITFYLVTEILNFYLNIQDI